MADGARNVQKEVQAAVKHRGQRENMPRDMHIPLLVLLLAVQRSHRLFARTSETKNLSTTTMHNMFLSTETLDNIL